MHEKVKKASFKRYCTGQKGKFPMNISLKNVNKVPGNCSYLLEKHSLKDTGVISL